MDRGWETGATGWRVLERVDADGREIALLRDDDADSFALIDNGVFLMSTCSTRSERAMIAVAAEHVGIDGLWLLGGLGVGASLEAAYARGVHRVHVAELEAAVIGWWRKHLMPEAWGSHVPAGIRVLHGDVLDVLAGMPLGRYDAVLLDTDNGPSWLVRDSNAAIYSRQGVALAASRLGAGGRLVYWASRPEPELLATLKEVCGDVQVEIVPRDPLPPDVLYIAAARPCP